MNKENGGSAFPMVVTEYNRDTDEHEVTSCGGMSLRDYYMAHAPITWLDALTDLTAKRLNVSSAELIQWLVEKRRQYADAMLAERSK